MATTKRTAKQTAPSATKRAAKQTARKVTKRAVKKAVVKKPAVRKATAGASGTARAVSRTTAPSADSTDAIARLKRDHRDVERLFERFEKAGGNAHAVKRQLVASMIEALSVHAEIEELVFYPAVRAEVSTSESEVLEALEEHHMVKLVLAELEDLDPSAVRFDAKVTVMMEMVRHHVKEEEGEFFPMVRSHVSRRELLALGDQIRNAKRIVPTRPHPFAPDAPPAKALVGGAVAVMDRARGVGRRAVERVRDELPSL